MNNTTTILIVDDQPNNLRFLNKILTQAGYKVQKAISGKLAISAANANPPDLILLDVMMPDLTGYKVCKILKKTQKTKEIPILFLSILDSSQDKVNGFKVGGADYIRKPFQVEEILACIHHHLTLQKLQKQLREQNNRLQQSQSLLESVLNTSIDGVAVFETQRNHQQEITDLKWVLINQSAEKMLFKTFELTDCNQVFQEACANLQLAIRQKQAIINCSFLPTLAAERSQLIQLFQNLLGNAIKYRTNLTPII